MPRTATPDAVAWGKVGQIVLSWVTSPLIGGVIVFGIFQIVRLRVLEQDAPLERLRRIGPLFFFYVFFTNIFEVVPVIQMPAAARIAMPMTLALIAYVVYHGAGFKSHGLGYFKHALVPPGVPIALLPLVMLIEFVSKFLVQPFSHTVRLFANLLAGHILLVTFAVLTTALVTPKWYAVFSPLPFAGVVFFTAFEVFVSFLQAYVFTLLTGVYINAAQSHEH